MKHLYDIGEIHECGATKTEARERAIAHAAEICTTEALTPMIVWGCPGQTEPHVVARSVDGWSHYRHGRGGLALGFYQTRETALDSAVTNVAQNAFDASEDGNDAQLIAEWITRTLPGEAGWELAAEFISWARWQLAYAAAKRDNPDLGNEGWRRLADQARG